MKTIDDARYKALKRLSTFAAETPLSAIPEAVIERAIQVLRDTVGVIVGGMAEPEVRRLAEYAADHYAGKASLLVTGAGVQPEWAGLVHGTAGTSLEMDEGHAYAYGHAAIHAVATALSCASAYHLSGKETLLALIMGYEVAARVGVASRLRDGVHPFGAWGVLGAAAIGARLMDFDAESMMGVLDVAASYAIAPSFNAAFQGANVRNTYAGMVNHNGLLAVEMYKLGFRGERAGAVTAFGQILGQSFDHESLTDGLGERYEISRGYFKPHSACRYSHAVIDAVLKLRHRVAIDEITKIEIDTYKLAASLNGLMPETPLAARFSIPYIAAAVLKNGHALPDVFTQSAIADSRALQLAAKVVVRENPKYTAMLPDARIARIVIHTSSDIHTAEAIGSKGDPDQPMTGIELRAKFDNLTKWALSAEQSEMLWEQMGDLLRIDDVAGLFANKIATLD
jgi:2-methylcitrate dehydratase PrpD